MNIDFIIKGKVSVFDTLKCCSQANESDELREVLITALEKLSLSTQVPHR